MAVVLGINAVFHDPAAALVIDGHTMAASEEERHSRRKHGKRPVAFSTWELPESAIEMCLRRAGIGVGDIDAVAYSYDPELCTPAPDLESGWDQLRTVYASRADRFLESVLGRPCPPVRHVPHHVAHAASAYLAGPYRDDCAVMVTDGRGERSSWLAGRCIDGRFDALASQPLPHSLGLLYEDVTEHLGFHRSSDEYKVMALASYGEPRFLDSFTRAVYVTEGGFRTNPIVLDELVPRRGPDEPFDERHADLASSMQVRLEQVLLELTDWLAAATGSPNLVMAGGVALNCVANHRIWARGAFDDVWVQPAAGDAGTALGAALYVAHHLGDAVQPVLNQALGSDWSDEEIGRMIDAAGLDADRVDDVAEVAAEALAANQVVAWFQGRSEFGPRALGHRSLLADPRDVANLERLNAIKGREQFRPVAPMVALHRAGEIFSGKLPSPHMLFVHDVHAEWASRIPAAVHVDGTARVQTVDPVDEPLVSRMLGAFERRTGVPVVINTSFNTAGRPMVDSPRDALECFGSAPIDLLAIGNHVLRRARRPRPGERRARPPLVGSGVA